MHPEARRRGLVVTARRPAGFRPVLLVVVAPRVDEFLVPNPVIRSNKGGKIDAKKFLAHYSVALLLYNLCFTLVCFQIVPYTLFLLPSNAR